MTDQRKKRSSKTKGAKTTSKGEKRDAESEGKVQAKAEGKADAKRVVEKAAKKVKKKAEKESVRNDEASAEQSDDTSAAEVERRELRRNMMRSIITEPLLSRLDEDQSGKFDVIIALNELYAGGLEGALQEVRKQAEAWQVKYSSVSNYVFARLSAKQIRDLAIETQRLIIENKRRDTVVYRIWEDSDVAVTLTRSLTTVKVDAAQRAFHALGEGIVWAVLDSGIDGDHVHFEEKLTLHGRIDSLGIRAPVEHRDYTPDGDARRAAQTTSTETKPETLPTNSNEEVRPGAASALQDRLGHGTHVAGIITGYWTTEEKSGLMVVGTEVRNESANDPGDDNPILVREALTSISGVAPLSKVVSLKVIADVTLTGDYKQTVGQGKVSWILRAINDIQQWNQHGRRLLVHGVNLSVGYEFDPRWFACGQSPICAEVNRLVKSGVCVVVSAGNSGFSSYISGSGTEKRSYNNLCITDPGNAELAITVGSTHRDMPHTYGVSYFSSRGPTGDGRRKPDLLAPGERIRSCAAGREQERYGVTKIQTKETVSDSVEPESPGTTAHAVEGPPSPVLVTRDRAPENGKVLYCEQTGTSMAAPHVSGAVAAFLSVRTEFIGQPERVKELFLEGAVDLGRERSFQGNGLLDLMKVLQAV